MNLYISGRKEYSSLVACKVLSASSIASRARISPFIRISLIASLAFNSPKPFTDTPCNNFFNFSSFVFIKAKVSALVYASVTFTISRTASDIALCKRDSISYRFILSQYWSLSRFLRTYPYCVE